MEENVTESVQEQEAAAPQEVSVQPETPALPREEFVRFFTDHRDVAPEQITEEVLRAVAGGGSLEQEWLRSENTRLRAENEALRQNEENRRHAAPSTQGSGRKQKDLIDEIWEEE